MSGKHSIREAILRRQPLIVGAIADPATFSEPLDGCDLLELRLDSLGWDDEVIAFAKKSPLPLLITARGPEEGGAGPLSVEQRREAYHALLPYASLIDIELQSFPHFEDLIALAQDQQILVVGSFHHFKLTPPLDDLAHRMGKIADIHKFATMVHSPEDIEVHLELLKMDSPLSVMGMGPLGAEARPQMMQAGSLLNYGYLGETATAPNQWPVRKLSESLRV